MAEIDVDKLEEQLQTLRGSVGAEVYERQDIARAAKVFRNNVDSGTRKRGLADRSMTITSSAARSRAIRGLVNDSGLRPDQVAGNSWGFPPVPIPEPRVANGITRLAPTNVNNVYLGHPIYWLDPELSERRANETLEEWSIRMYLTLAQAGYWTKSGGWVDFLAIRGFNFDRPDVEGYHTMSNRQISIDKPDVRSRYRLISENDINGKAGLREIDAKMARVKKRMGEILDYEVGRFLNSQINSMRFGMEVMGTDPMTSSATPDHQDSEWERKIQPSLFKLSDKYNATFNPDSGVKMSDLIDEMHKKMEGSRNFIIAIEDAASNISVPVLDGYPEYTLAESFGHMLTYQNIARDKALSRRGRLDFLTDAERVFAEDREPGAMDGIISRIYNAYAESWRRLRVAMINYYLSSIGESPLKSYGDIELLITSIEEDATEQARQDEIERTMSEMADERATEDARRSAVHSDAITTEFDQNMEEMLRSNSMTDRRTRSSVQRAPSPSRQARPRQNSQPPRGQGTSRRQPPQGEPRRPGRPAGGEQRNGTRNGRPVRDQRRGERRPPRRNND